MATQRAWRRKGASLLGVSRALALVGLLVAALVAGLTTSAHADRKAGKVRILERRTALGHPTLGPDSAPVKIEFFVDLADGQSGGRLHRLLRELAQHHPKRLQVVYRLTERSERNSTMAQNLGRAAFEAGRFWEFLDAYYGNRNRPPIASQYEEIAKEVGLDYAQVQEDAQHGLYDAIFEANYFRTRRMYVSQIPGLLVNGRPHPQPSTAEALEDIYDRAYDETLVLAASGIERDAIVEHIHKRERQQRAEQIPRVAGPIEGEALDEAPQSPTAVAMGPLLRGSHRQGPSNAKITAAFVCHLQGSVCRLMYGYLQSLRREYPDELEIVFHPYFDPDRSGEELAGVMYEGALCADKQGAFFEFYEYALEHNRRMNFDESLAVELAASPALDLDVPRFERCMKSKAVAKQVREEVAVVRKLGIRHTPAFAINGLLFYGRLQNHELRIIVDQELEPGFIDSLARP